MSRLEENKPNNGGEVVITFSSTSTPNAETDAKMSPLSPTSNIPIANDNNLLRRRSFARSLVSKPKSRFGEQPCILDDNALDEHRLTLQQHFTSKSPPHVNLSSVTRTISIAPKTPLGFEAEEEDEEEEEKDLVRQVEIQQRKSKRGQTVAKFVVQWAAILIIVACLVASLTVHKLKRTTIWGLVLWKWFVVIIVIFYGLLVTSWLMQIVVLLIEINFLLRKKVLYFVHGLKKSVQVFIWIGFVLGTWLFVFKGGVNASKTATKILDFVTWTLISLLIGSFLWLLKTLSMKILASNYHVKRYFARIQESVYHQYVLQTLSGPPLTEEAEKVGKVPSTGLLSVTKLKGKRTNEKRVIDMGEVQRMKKEKVSAWTMKVLVDAVTKSGFSTISDSLDESSYGVGGQADNGITNELEANVAALRIFRNVAQHRRSKYIEEEDLLRFMIKEEVDLFFPLIEGSESGRIDKKAFTTWVVKVYNGRRTLAHALKDTKTAVKQLNKLVMGIVIVVAIIIWLLLLEIATTKVIVFLSSQLLLAAFMFGNTCKTIFEAIIFVFVMHPFDVGDRCVVAGVPLLVEEMNILTTVFLTLNNEKIFYPNSVLATKPISNYYRSPDMGDTVEFSIDFATPVEKIGLLRDRIKNYLEKNPQHWHPNHNIVVKEIEEVNKLKMALYCNHTMNFQEFAEKNKRRTELMMEMKKIFEELSIKYYLLPQHVYLSNVQKEESTDALIAA